MSLFEVIAGAIANPEQQASTDQLSSILGAVQSITGAQTGDPGNASPLLSAVGSVVKGALQNQQSSIGQGGVEDLINQFAGSGANADAISALFGGQEQQIVEAIAQRTGLDAQQINAALPALVPLVLQLLQGGASSGGGNSVLNAFLDSDQDGDVDLGDVMTQASRFLGQ